MPSGSGRANALAAPLEYTEYQRKEWPGFLLARGRAEEATAAAGELTRGKWPATRAAGHVILGQLRVSKGRVEDPQAELALADKELDAIPAGPPTPRRDVAPYVDRLRGEILIRTGRADDGRALLKEVQGRIRAVAGPDAWMQALFVLESIAYSARQAGECELVEYMARQMHDHDPAYAGAHTCSRWWPRTATSPEPAPPLRRRRSSGPTPTRTCRAAARSGVAGGTPPLTELGCCVTPAGALLRSAS